MSITEFLRSTSNNISDTFFLFISMLGSDLVSTMFIALVLWCIDKKTGQLIAFCSFVSFSVNGFLKDIFKVSRPFLNDLPANEKAVQSLKNISGGYSYSFPSGHAEVSASVGTVIIKQYKKRILTIISVLLVFLIGFSRVYLGVHYSIDVIAGWIIGIVITLFCYKLFYKFYDKRIILYIAFSVLLLFSVFLWSDDTAKALGGLAGFALGCAFEKRYVNYEIVKNAKLVLRLVLGLAMLYGLRVLLKSILPYNMFFLYIRYMMLTFIGTGLYPYVFKKLNF